MSVQKQRHTKARRDRARKMLKLEKQELVKCSNCSAMIVSHRACPKCGFYKGKEAIDTMKKLAKPKK